MYKAPLVGLPHRLQVKPTWFSSKRPTARMKLKFFASPVPPDVTVLNGVGVLGIAWSGEDVLTRHHVERWKRGGGGGYEMQWLRRRGGVARAGRRRGAHRWPAASPEAGSPPPAIRCCPPPFSTTNKLLISQAIGSATCFCSAGLTRGGATLSPRGVWAPTSKRKFSINYQIFIL